MEHYYEKFYKHHAPPCNALLHRDTDRIASVKLPMSSKKHPDPNLILAPLQAAGFNGILLDCTTRKSGQYMPITIQRPAENCVRILSAFFPFLWKRRRNIPYNAGLISLVLFPEKQAVPNRLSANSCGICFPAVYRFLKYG